MDRLNIHVNFIFLTDPRKIEVNVTTPQQIFDSDWGLLGTVYAEYVNYT